MIWTKGAEVINEMPRRGDLEQVPPDPDEATYLLAKAGTHLCTARANSDDDPEMAYDALYASARKAVSAILQQQGLRATSRGGHDAVIDAVLAQIGTPQAANSDSCVA